MSLAVSKQSRVRTLRWRLRVSVCQQGDEDSCVDCECATTCDHWPPSSRTTNAVQSADTGRSRDSVEKCTSKTVFVRSGTNLACQEAFCCVRTYALGLLGVELETLRCTPVTDSWYTRSKLGKYFIDSGWFAVPNALHVISKQMMWDAMAQ